MMDGGSQHEITAREPRVPDFARARASALG
jgi:hypothetical protein